MPGKPVTIGPFKGGLNTVNDPSAVGDNELVECVNFDGTLDGSLLSRPPVVSMGSTGQTTRTLFLGIFPLTVGKRIIGSSGTNIVQSVAGSWSVIKSGTTSLSAQMYKNKVWVTSNNGGNGGNTDGTTWTDVASMPKGDASIIYKERLFIGGGVSQVANSARLYYSEPGDLTNWPSINFIDVGSGDGDFITAFAVVNNNLVIFKNNSTYVLSYSTNPGLGTLTKVSATIGASAVFGVCQRQQSLYVLHNADVYEFINYNYTKLNIKVQFDYDPTVPTGGAGLESTFVCIVGDRLLIRYYKNTYVLSLITGAWTQWKSDLNYGPWVLDIPDVATSPDLVYLAGSYVSNDPNYYKFVDGYGLLTENMTCTLTTKIMSFGQEGKFKRQFWWGADLISTVDVLGEVLPVAHSFTITWNQAKTYTWNQILALGGTWNSPTYVLPAIKTTVTFTGAGQRRFVKFLQGLRFRQVQYRISLNTDGTSPPVRLFSLQTFVLAKEKVVEQVS